MKRSACIILFLFLVSGILFGENILLKDGGLVKGKLVNLNKNKISLMVDDRIIEFSIDQIEYMIAQVSQDKYSTIFIRRNSGAMMKVNLIKLTETALYYKNLKEDELRLIKLSAVGEISLENSTIAKVKKENYSETDSEEIIDINDDLDKIIEQLNKSKTDSTLNVRTNGTKTEKVDIESADFYEKFWSKIYKYLDINRENLLWNLLEDYSDKEKSLNLIYNEGLNQQSDTKNDNIKSKILKLRNDFYKRAKKILISR